MKFLKSIEDLDYFQFKQVPFTSDTLTEEEKAQNQLVLMEKQKQYRTMLEQLSQYKLSETCGLHENPTFKAIIEQLEVDKKNAF